MPEGPEPTTRDRIFAAARTLAETKPIDQIGLSDVARAAKVSWPTVKRYVGSKQALRQQLLDELPDLKHRFAGTRDRLLEAAATVFARRGYERATLDEVAAAANMTKGAVYWHFQNKSELLTQLLEPFARMVRPGQAAEPRQWLADEVRAATSQTERSRLLIQFLAQLDQPAVRKGLQQTFRAQRLELERGLATLQERREISSTAVPADLALVMCALLRGLLIECLVDPTLVDRVERAAEIIDGVRR